MPQVVTTPKELRPYIFHGVDLQTNGGNQAVGDCPFCGREGKFDVNVNTGQWCCHVCQTGNKKGGGNAYTFIRLLWEESDKATNGATRLFAAERKLLYPETLTYWGVCQSIITNEWLIPGYGIDGKLNQLYKQIKTPERRELRPTPTLTHQLHGIPLYDKKKHDIYLHESWGNALAFWEVMRITKKDGSGIMEVGSEASSMLANTNVLAVANCGAVGEPLKKFAPLFSGKRLFFMFDSDHPKLYNGKVVLPAGYAATRRAVSLLANCENPPKEIHWLAWGPEGYDKNVKSGFDVRDWFATRESAELRVASLPTLLKLVEPIPADWIPGRSEATVSRGGTEIELLPCYDWKTLTNAWRKALKWTPGLDRALSVMLACVMSTKRAGDQLWVKVMGPASCGKSILCEALSTNKKYVHAKSTIRGLHSGYSDGSEKNHSPLQDMIDKTLVIKDGDTLLSTPNLTQILSELRDVYDRVSRSSYRTKQSKDWEGLNITVILCGTASLRQLDSSELGERMVDCVVVDDMDEELEREIGRRVASRAFDEVDIESNGQAITSDSPVLSEAKLLTGGYVKYLRDNSDRLVKAVTAEQSVLDRCQSLAEFTAFFRARPSKKQAEKAERELSFRLISQMVRLAKCLAVVMNRTSVDEEVMSRVRRVALDTARGRTLDLAEHLYAVGRAGCSLASLAILVGDTDDNTRTLLRFLKQIAVVEVFQVKITSGLESRPKWRLTPRLSRLYSEVMESA